MDTDKQVLVLARKYKKQFIKYGLKYNLDILNNQLLKCFLYDQFEKLKNNKTPNVEHSIKMIKKLQEYKHSQYSIFERYKKLYNISHGVNKEKLLLRYGEEEGLKRWNHYCSKQAETNTFAYKHKKYGITKKEFEEYNASRAVTLNNMIKRYGEEEGLKRWNEYCKKQSYVGVSKEYFIEKYGEEKGIKKYKEVCKSHCLTLVNFQSKWGKDLGIKKFNDCYSNLNNGYSKISQELFNSITPIENKGETFYATNNKEKYFHHIPTNTYGFIDYCYKNKVIEFYGDYWHANPEIYKKDDLIKMNNKKMIASDKWILDKKRIDALKELGYDVKIIWERDYLKNKEQIIQECKQFLTN